MTGLRYRCENCNETYQEVDCVHDNGQLCCPKCGNKVN